MQRIFLLLNTLRYLKPIQVRYQLWYRIRKVSRRFMGYKVVLSQSREGKPVILAPSIPKRNTVEAETFSFLNKKKTYPQYDINWNESGYGKLWAYNLNYMDYILQDNIQVKLSLQWIHHFIQTIHQNKVGLDPYPIALRGINWIKFLSSQTINQSISATEIAKINATLYAQYQILSDNLEYHLLGNHLLEDGFSLLFGAFYFNERALFDKSVRILKNELNEQILGDGAHFELSPMYHQIILDRLLDCINLMGNNKRFDDQETLEGLMRRKAGKMLTWLNSITFANGEIPLLNDSAPEIAPTTQEINDYAHRLKIDLPQSKRSSSERDFLKNSGYRKYKSAQFECIVDIGQIGPSYQPGHAHADTFNFVVNSSYGSFIVDNGISTYEPNSTRLSERGTAAHNTVTVEDKNSSEVWSSFRVANRANVKIIEDKEDQISATHDGYKKLGVVHKRDWKFSEDKIYLEDTLYGKVTCGISHLHFAPGLTIEQNGHSLTIGNSLIEFTNASDIKVIEAKIPDGYNRYLNHYKAEVTFDKHLSTLIKFKLK